VKTTILIQDGSVQIVLTPETKFEKEVIEKYGEQADKAQIFHGHFDDCIGGWTRIYKNDTVDSLMIKLRDGEQK
jgi:hypothetical protein